MNPSFIFIQLYFPLGSDHAIFLWHYLDSEAAPDLFGEDDAIDRDDQDEPKENWAVWKILRGHLQDVLSLDFSPNSHQLVSCSTDGSAIIFDINKGTKLKILGDHKGWVNGVAWDPMEKFVTSIASDR